jgi:L-lactate dehydrogenase complex protein LldG
VSRALVADDPWLDELGVPEALAGAGLEVVRWPTGRDWRELLGLEGPAWTCGVTVPAWAVAERGTLALEAGAMQGRSIDVACTHHLAVLPAGRIVPTLADGLARSFRSGGRPASAVSLVSGPSRTSDIEKISTLGAHGALAEHVLIVEDGPGGEGGLSG